METGSDILFFWVARMIMMGLYTMGEVPFSKVYLHAMVRAQDGQKMSKVKGNVIDPLHMIYGAAPQELDPQLHRELLAQVPRRRGCRTAPTPCGLPWPMLATPGRDVRLDVSRMEGYRGVSQQAVERLALCANEPMEDFTPRRLRPPT